jgi:hypothetical protein
MTVLLTKIASVIVYSINKEADMIQASFTIHKTWYNNESGGSGINRRFWKVVYTAALRLGEQLDLNDEKIFIDIDVEPYPEVVAHRDNESFLGKIKINGTEYNNVIVIAGPRAESKFRLISFWPKSQHPDAHKSYTDPLVDTAIDGTPFPVDIVATEMHQAFTNNPGVSPAVLMQKIYDKRDIASQEKISELGSALDDALAVALRATLQAEKAEETKAEALAALAEKEKETIELQGTISTQATVISNQDKHIADLQSAIAKLNAQPEAELVDYEPAQQVTAVWQSKTGSDYMNVGIKAYVKEVQKAEIGNKIHLTYVNENGHDVTITDFAYQGFVSTVFSYLSSRVNKEAVFLITWRPGQQIKLAADTMMLPQYRNLWASQKGLPVSSQRIFDGTVSSQGISTGHGGDPYGLIKELLADMAEKKKPDV